MPLNEGQNSPAGRKEIITGENPQSEKKVEATETNESLEEEVKKLKTVILDNWQHQMRMARLHLILDDPNATDSIESAAYNISTMLWSCFPLLPGGQTPNINRINLYNLSHRVYNFQIRKSRENYIEYAEQIGQFIEEMKKEI